MISGQEAYVGDSELSLVDPSSHSPPPPPAASASASKRGRAGGGFEGDTCGRTSVEGVSTVEAG
jgi:hypothetical protein